jgi:hypothetical protein
MQCKQAHEYAHIKCNQSNSWACSPYLCASLIQEFWSFSIAQCCSLLVHCPCPNPQLSYLCLNLSPFVIKFHKRCVSLDTKGCIRVDGWHLNLAIFMDITWLLEWHHLYSSWDTTHRIFDLDTKWRDTSPYVIAWVIHLKNLISYRWGMHSSFDDHLKLRVTCGTIVLHDWYHV